MIENNKNAICFKAKMSFSKLGDVTESKVGLDGYKQHKWIFRERD